MSTHHGILVHIVFSTKCRVALLVNSWRDDLFAYIGGTIKEHKAVLLKAGGIEDHVHLLVKFHPQYAVAARLNTVVSQSVLGLTSQAIVCRCFAAHDLWVTLRSPDPPTGCA